MCSETRRKQWTPPLPEERSFGRPHFCPCDRTGPRASLCRARGVALRAQRSHSWVLNHLWGSPSQARLRDCDSEFAFDSLGSGWGPRDLRFLPVLQGDWRRRSSDRLSLVVCPHQDLSAFESQLSLFPHL